LNFSSQGVLEKNFNIKIYFCSFLIIFSLNETWLFGHLDPPHLRIFFAKGKYGLKIWREKNARSLQTDKAKKWSTDIR
jgi:hypothetical protein